MNRLYAAAQTTRQTHQVLRRRREQQEDRFLLLSAVLVEERQRHPSMSLKKLYHRLKPDFIGRDAFVDFGMENGFEPIFSFKKPQITRSGDLRAYPNLLHDLKICDINQVWASDITYFKVTGKWCYIVLIEDLYSRQIIGWKASENLFAQANCDALKMATDLRAIARFDHKLIHHSDRGAQYRSLIYTQKLQENEIQISMGYSCFDNAFLESANNIIKNEYLIHRPIHGFKDLIKYLEQDVNLYNTERPHGSLNLMTPVQFERYILNIPICQRTLLPIFTDKSKKNKLLLFNPDDQQLRLMFP
jgi:putative transposase